MGYSHGVHPVVVPRCYRVAIRALLALGLSMAGASCQSAPGPPTTTGTVAPATSRPGATPRAQPPPGWLAPPALPGQSTQIPAVATRRSRLEAAASQEPPILLLDEELDADQRLAQDLAVHDPRVSAWARDVATGQPLRTEVLGIYATHPSDFPPGEDPCTKATCYRVELYNHARAAAVVAIINVTSQDVLDVSEYPGLQPDIPPGLRRLAEEIAVGAPEVSQALGYTPRLSDASMAASKTALNETSCERARHLCVAPTFLKGDRALWAIVDLTDGVLVGTRWTSLGKSGQQAVVTERKLADEVITALYCERQTDLRRGDWSMSYILTSSDGLLVSDVTYKDKPVLDSAKLVDWHVSYSGRDAFGYSDAVGCPTFSQAAVVAHRGPLVDDIVTGGRTVGFSLTQDFVGEFWPAPCQYYYRQRFDFYRDGRFRIVAGNLGRGCGNQGTYRPVLRIAIAGDRNTVSSWNGRAWDPWPREGYQQQDESPISPEGFQLKVGNQDGGGYYVEPGRGQFGDGGRGDHAFTYVTLNKPNADEGKADLITIGPCCNADYRQGPERFIDSPPESIAGQHLVLWYVPQMKNDDRAGQEYCWADTVLEHGLFVPKSYPCFAGPMFLPFTE